MPHLSTDLRYCLYPLFQAVPKLLEESCLFPSGGYKSQCC